MKTRAVVCVAVVATLAALRSSLAADYENGCAPDIEELERSLQFTPVTDRQRTILRQGVDEAEAFCDAGNVLAADQLMADIRALLARGQVSLP